MTLTAIFYGKGYLTMFIGRNDELQLLQEKYKTKKSELVVVYGRRRVGKTALIKKFIGEKEFSISYEGIEAEQSLFQISSLAKTIAKSVGDTYINTASFREWDSLFLYLTQKIEADKARKKKFILFFDEFQWMASGRGRLVAIIKYFWDNHWKESNVMLILCGSIASFMVKKVVSSKALYGRISTEMLLKGLQPSDAAKIFQNKRDKEEVLKYLLVFGGVPKYLEEIDLNKSFSQNINLLCFSSNSFMITEMKKIFYSQFKEGATYIRIVNYLRNTLLTQSEVAKKLHKKSGGSLKDSLTNLESAGIIKGFHSFDKNWRKRYLKYRLVDEFLSFHFKYIDPNLEIISESPTKKLFEMITDKSFSIWLGFAFERFCIKHALFIAEKSGFADQVIAYGPYFMKGEKSFQIDLLYKRVDNVITICEIKYHSTEIKASIIQDMEKKLSLLEIPKGYTAEKMLISVHGPSEQLADSGYFNHLITIDDFFREGYNVN